MRRTDYRFKWMRHSWLRRPFVVATLPVVVLYHLVFEGARERLRHAAYEIREAWGD